MRIKHEVGKFRVALNMSKAALARRIGVVRSYVTKLESEQLEPSGLVMLRLAHVFEQPVDKIFQLSEKPAGQAPFQPISRRVSVRAGESIKPAENNTREKVN